MSMSTMSVGETSNNDVAIAVNDVVPDQKEKESRQSETVCAICLESIDNGKRLYETQCHHRFHADCIGTSAQFKNSCPLCRSQLYNVVDDFVEACGLDAVVHRPLSADDTYAQVRYNLRVARRRERNRQCCKFCFGVLIKALYVAFWIARIAVLLTSHGISSTEAGKRLFNISLGSSVLNLLDNLLRHYNTVCNGSNENSVIAKVNKLLVIPRLVFDIYGMVIYFDQSAANVAVAAQFPVVWVMLEIFVICELIVFGFCALVMIYVGCYLWLG